MIKAQALLLVLGAAATTAHAARVPDPAGSPAAQGGEIYPDFRLGSHIGGQIVFERHCAVCHGLGNRAATAGRGLNLSTLRQLTPERILDALVTGKMAAVGAQLSPDERRSVAEWLGGRAVGATRTVAAADMSHRCEKSTPIRMSAERDWNGWSPRTDNARYQTAGSLQAEDVPSLQLRWAFGLPETTEAFSQPSFIGGQIFIGGDNGTVYSIEAKTGCVSWSYAARAAVRTAPVGAQLPGRAEQVAIFFGDIKGRAYAIDAHTGKELWVHQVDDGPFVKITGAPTVHGNQLFVGTTKSEEVTAAASSYECCKARGAVVALDISTGKEQWKTYLVKEAARPVGTNAEGTQRWAPAGVGTWSAPTVDAERGVVYVGTGESSTLPAAELSDSIVAMDMQNGAVLWHYQATADDAWLAGCEPGKPWGNCPDPLGPDWDFASSAMLVRRAGQDMLIAADKGGTVVALDPRSKGRVLWQRRLSSGPVGPGGDIMFGGASDASRVFYGLVSGDLVSLDVRDGAVRWRTSIASARPPHRGISAALSLLPGTVFAGGWDGVLRAFDAERGQLVWSFDTVRSFETVNGVPGRGGSMGAPGPVIAAGMLFVTSGYIGTENGMSGNVLLAFAPAPRATPPAASR